MSGTAKPPAPQSPLNNQLKTSQSQTASSGFFASLFSSFGAATTAAPVRTPTPLPPAPVEEVDPLRLTESNVILSIFSAEVDVKLERKMVLELQRSTKKNPPTSLRVDLIYVSCNVETLGFNADVCFRRPANLNMTPVKRRTGVILGVLEVSFKVSELIWMGKEITKSALFVL